MVMRLNVLGASGAFPGPDRACSGYVVEHAGTRVVVDLGWGTLPRLFAHLGGHHGDEVDAIAVTHEHPDHTADLYGFFRARWYTRRQAPPIPLIAPRPVVDALVAAAGDEDPIRQVFEWVEAPGESVEVGTVRLSTVELPHYVLNAGVRVEADEVAVAFTGDTGPSPSLAELGREAAMYVVDATDRHQQPGVEPAPPGTPQFNLTAADAGAAASAAGAHALMLTHHWPGNDLDRSRADAAAHYAGPVFVASDGLAIDLPVTDRHERRRPVSSSALASAGYDERTKTLEIEFVSGEIYRYLDVDAATAEALFRAESMGAFVNQHIKPAHRYVYLGPS